MREADQRPDGLGKRHAGATPAPPSKKPQGALKRAPCGFF